MPAVGHAGGRGLATGMDAAWCAGAWTGSNDSRRSIALHGGRASARAKEDGEHAAEESHYGDIATSPCSRAARTWKEIGIPTPRSTGAADTGARQQLTPLRAAHRTFHVLPHPTTLQRHGPEHIRIPSFADPYG